MILIPAAWILFNLLLIPALSGLFHCYPDGLIPVRCPDCDGADFVGRDVQGEVVLHCANCRLEVGSWYAREWSPSYADRMRVRGYLTAALTTLCLLPALYLTLWV